VTSIAAPKAILGNDAVVDSLKAGCEARMDAIRDEMRSQNMHNAMMRDHLSALSTAVQASIPALARGDTRGQVAAGPFAPIRALMNGTFGASRKDHLNTSSSTSRGSTYTPEDSNISRISHEGLPEGDISLDLVPVSAG
jgi:hypothetical protein